MLLMLDTCSILLQNLFLRVKKDKTALQLKSSMPRRFYESQGKRLRFDYIMQWFLTFLRTRTP